MVISMAFLRLKIGRLEVPVSSSFEVSAAVCREMRTGLAGLLALELGPSLPAVQSLGIQFINTSKF